MPSNNPDLHPVSQTDGADAAWVKTHDNFRLRFVHWPAASSSKGSIFIFQGRSEIAEKYGPIASVFTDRGYHVCSIDWRGQGKSQRVSNREFVGHCSTFEAYQNDVLALCAAAEARNLPKPWYILGHSMGALIGVRAILRDPTCFSAAAFTSPMFALNLSRVKSTLVHVLARGLRTVGMSDLVAPGQSPVPYVLNTAFHDNALTSDPEQYEFYKRVTESLPNDKIGGVTYGWVSAALREVSHLAALSKPLPISSAFLFGTKDQIIDRHGSASLARYLSNSNVTEFPNAKHDILFERPDIHSEAVSDILSTFSVK